MDTQQQNRFSTLTHGGVSFKDEKPLMISEVKMILQRKIENARQADAEMLLSPYVYDNTHIGAFHTRYFIE